MGPAIRIRPLGRRRSIGGVARRRAVAGEVDRPQRGSADRLRVYPDRQGGAGLQGQPPAGQGARPVLLRRGVRTMSERYHGAMAPARARCRFAHSPRDGFRRSCRPVGCRFGQPDVVSLVTVGCAIAEERHWVCRTLRWAPIPLATPSPTVLSEIAARDYHRPTRRVDRDIHRARPSLCPAGCNRERKLALPCGPVCTAVRIPEIGHPSGEQQDATGDKGPSQVAPALARRAGQGRPILKVGRKVGWTSPRMRKVPRQHKDGAYEHQN